jgi:RNA-binding protein 25
MSVDWKTIAALNLLQVSVRGWVTKELFELLGEEEPALVDFIMTKLASSCSPQELEAELEPALDKDAEKIVTALWKQLLTQGK